LCPSFAKKPQAIPDQEESSNQRRKPERQPEPQEFNVAIHRNKNNGAAAAKQYQQQSNENQKYMHQATPTRKLGDWYTDSDGTKSENSTDSTRSTAHSHKRTTAAMLPALQRQ
jgi:hypothetical protein